MKARTFNKLMLTDFGLCLRATGLLLGIIVAVTKSAHAQERQSVIVVVGADGTAQYGEMFSAWADRWQRAAVAGEADVVVIGRDDGDKSLQELRQSISESVTVKASEPLWLVLIGHGTFDGRTARFNLKGKDLSAGKAAEMLATAARPVAVINCTSCSAPFINALSGQNRTVISATKDGGEIQFARFGGFIAEAVGNLEADLDRDGQTSLLEAWLFAARRTAEYYEADGRLATEHSLLDDNGDGKGTRFEAFEGVNIKANVRNKEALDGKLAKRWHLVRSEEEKKLSPDQRLERDRLEGLLEELKTRKKALSEEQYLAELEVILIQLARIYSTTEKRAR